MCLQAGWGWDADPKWRRDPKRDPWSAGRIWRCGKPLFHAIGHVMCATHSNDYVTSNSLLAECQAAVAREQPQASSRQLQPGDTRGAAEEVTGDNFVIHVRITLAHSLDGDKWCACHLRAQGMA